MPIRPIRIKPPRVPKAGEEQGEGVPSLPPQPQPSELYPGYQAEIQNISRGIYDTSERVRESQKSLESIQTRGYENLWTRAGRAMMGGILPPLGALSALSQGAATEEEYNQNVAQAQAALDASTQQLASSEWQLQVLNTLPAYLSSRRYIVRNTDDVLQLIPHPNLTDTDRAWLERTLDKMSGLNNILPEDFDGSVAESQQAILDKVLTEPKMELRAVHNLTIEELKRSFQSGYTELPEGLTPEDVRGVLGQMELGEEADKELQLYVMERASAWAKESERLELLRTGLLQAESPELTPGEFANLMFTQPLMGGVELLNKYFDMLPRPLASAAIIGTHQAFNTPDETLAGRMAEIYQYYREHGESTWDSYTRAINEVDMPWWLRMGIESSFDPTTYVGMGIATSAAYKTGSLLTRLGMRTIGARVGPLVGSFENGFIMGADATFQVGKEVLLSPVKGSFWLAGSGYQIPRTLTQLSRNFARYTSLNFKATIERAFPDVRNMAGMTAKDIRETAQASIDAYLTRPTEGGDLMVKTGANLLEFSYLDADDAAKLLRGVVSEGFDFDDIRLARVNDEVLNMLSGQDAKITAGNIISDMGYAGTDESVESVLSKLYAFKDDIEDDALRPFRSENPTDQLIGMFNRSEQIRYDNLKNPISAHLTQAGRASSWVSRVADRVLYSSGLVALERRVVMPFARWNLLFANFGPFNFTENMGRSFLGGAEIMYPRSYGGVAETNRLFRGLSNAPYELVMAERGTQRFEMALIDPKTGSTSAFRNGRIPFVTREVNIHGKTIGKTINIRGMDFKLTDMQSYNDMWETLTTIQRAYDYQVHYMKALPEIAPDEMQMITENVLKRRSQLEQIKKFSSKDMSDMERTLIQDSTVGPEAVMAHADIDTLDLERRQISKELGKVFDKCTDVRNQTKMGIRNEVLDGSIFSDIDGRVAAYGEMEREMSLASLAAQTDALINEAQQIERIYGGKASLLDEVSQNIRFGETIPEEVTGMKEYGKVPIILDGEEIGSLLYWEGAIDPTNFVVDTLKVGKTGVLNRRLLQDIDLLAHEFAKSKGATKVTIINKPEHSRFYKAAGYTKGSDVGVYKDLMQPSTPPQSLDDLLGDMENLNALVTGVEERIHDYRRLVELRSHNLNPGKEIDDFHRGSNQLLNEFLDQSQEQIDKIVDNLQNFIESRPKLYDAKGNEIPLFQLTEPQQKAVTGLNNIYKLETRNIINTRRRLAEVESKIPNTPRGKRNSRFWQQQRAQKSVIWDAHEDAARRLRNLRLDASRQFLGSVGRKSFLPESIPPVTHELTPHHIAYLFGVAGDDVYRGLTRVHNHITITPKQDFVDYTRNQAEAYAAKFDKTAADIGFTEEAIGNVYDQLWRNLGIEPNVLTPDSPTMMHLEEIRQELNKLHAAVKMDETDVANWRQYVQGVAEGVRQMPMYSVEQLTADELLIREGRELVNRARSLGGTPPTEVESLSAALDRASAATEGERLTALREVEALEDTIREYIEAEPGVMLYKPRTGAEDWFNKKESAMAEARKQHELAYPTYDDANVIDETMRAIFPFWCTPEDTKILTRAGWKHYKQLTIGEDVLTVNPDTLITEWQPVQKIAEFDYDDELMVIPAKGKDIKFTPNHRWLVTNKGSDKAKVKRGYELKEVSDFIPRALPHSFPSSSVLGPRLAAILGWVVAEGYLQTSKTQRPYFLVYQHRNNYIAEIEAATGTKAYPRSNINDSDNMVIRVSADDTAKICEVYSGKDSLPSLVPQLSRGATEAMWRAMMLGEGSFGEAYNETAIDEWSQQPGPVSEAFQMLSVLLGKAITVGKHNGSLDKVYFNNNRQPYQAKQCRRMYKEHYTGKVWCPVTANGTWFANFNGSILPTGNTYEAFRWRWIPRTWMRTPGTMTGLARYVDYTDGGYIPVPGTDLQLNPLRGSIWMGGLRRFWLKDFPEYYDAVPGMEFVDYLSRAGFYPGIHIMGPVAAFGALAQNKPEMSEVAPSWVKTGLSALRGLSPEHIGKVLDVVYPDRFRDFQTMLTLGELGYDADEIWRKKQQGIALTEEEEKLWLRAEAKANGLKGILMEQTGLFRIRPGEYEELRREMRLAIEEATGVPVRVQQHIDRLYPATGKRFSDYYKLDVLQQKLLYESEAYRRWQGIVTPLYPSSWQDLEVKIRDYYESLEQNSNEARLQGVYEDGELIRPSMVDINQQLVDGIIGPDQWRSFRSEIQSGLAEAARLLGESPAYKDVPKTLEEREAWLEQKNIPLPTYGPDQELLWYYYEIQPELAYNWESDRVELDFDTYYAKIDVLLESLDESYRQRLLDRIQLDWTPLERLYWTVSREYFRSYRNLRNIVLSQYTDEKVQQIRRYEVARGEEREQLKQVEGPDGKKLISGFQSAVREARQRLRYADPDLDAWSYFWGTTDTFLTQAAEDRYSEFKEYYLTQKMIQ